MNCKIFETVVNDLAREQMMEANARQEALTHSDDCEACALRLALERRLTLGLRALVEEMTFVSASAQVEAQLLEAFRIQTSVAQTQPVKRSRYWVATAAAAILIVFGIAALKWGHDGPTQNAINSSPNSYEPRSPESAIVATGQPNSRPTPKQVPALDQPRRRQLVRSLGKHSSLGSEAPVAQRRVEETTTTEASNSALNEVTTQFLPLSYTSPVNLQDGGQLVRVEMPRSAMASFGLPVNMERYGEKVKADVLVSADGLARAIRFVQ
jgi:hypothetical protein